MTESLGPLPRFGIIGGSGVQVEGKENFLVKTPFGDCLLTCLDNERRIVFANRHLCTNIDGSTGKASYAPPHLVNFRALIWALVVECRCGRDGQGGVVALGSTGSLYPEKIPVGSVVMPDDYYMVRPEAVTFWGHEQVGSFAAPESGGLGRIHYTPANPDDGSWLALRRRVQSLLMPLLEGFESQQKIQRVTGQSPDIWPCVHSTGVGKGHDDSIVYVNTIGPRFETRAEIRQYAAAGHVVGMTCGNEWILCEELQVPYVLICFCDNSCNGLSTFPGGALEEYLHHKKSVTEVTSAVVDKLVTGLPA
eukprot:gnl/TRDRNA2_/TRDRNA2_64716_c0_seq2.p1 gnl/TRDRNA2_/TRDRNA2_64716_c0~~gnl/TRDRNA2_/TRDRNA2_64716_c0_seq2.p1  ORF type:complete len:307 (+),score=51.31 gnl/TRDRNA2_/TRDRNA2_64716_c0_seq2:123-1043(+)